MERRSLPVTTARRLPPASERRYWRWCPGRVPAAANPIPPAVRLAVLVLFLILPLTASWTGRSPGADDVGIELPEVVVVGRDTVVLEGFRDFSLMPLIAPGRKLEPQEDRLELAARKPDVDPQWTAPAVSSPGCAYRNAVTAYVARGFTGAEGYYLSGKQKYLEGLQNEARYYLDEMLRRYPESGFSSSAHYWLGEIAFRQQDRQCAATHFLAAVADSAGQYRGYAFYSLGWLAHAAGDYREAAQHFAAVAGSEPASLQPAAAFWQGESRFRADDRVAAAAVLDDLLERFPHSAYIREASYLLASMAFNRQEYAAAREYLTRIVGSAPGVLPDDDLGRQALLADAWCLYYLGDYEPALTRFALLLPPAGPPPETMSPAFLGRGMTLIRLDRPDEALALVEQRPQGLRQVPAAAAVLRRTVAALAAADRPADANVAARMLLADFPDRLLETADFLGLAERCEILAQTGQALDAVLQGVAFAGRTVADDIVLTLERARLLSRLGRHEEAVAVLELVRDRDLAADHRSRLRVLFARAYNALGAWRQAQAAVAGPFPPEAREQAVIAAYEHGWACFRLGEYAAALTAFEEFLAGYGESAAVAVPELLHNAVLNRGECLFNLHRDIEAAAVFEDFRRRFPASPYGDRACYYLGWISLRRGEHAAALEFFDRVLAEYPDTGLQSAVLYQRGMTRFAMADYPRAVESFELLLRRFPAAPEAGPAMLRIGESRFNAGAWLQTKLAYLRAAQTFAGTEIEEQARYGLLLLALKQQNYGYLETEARRFLERFPRSSYVTPLILLLADVYQERREWQPLDDILAQVLAGDFPAAVRLEALYRRLDSARTRGDREAAARWAREIIAFAADSKYICDCHLLLGRQAWEAGDLDAARGHLEEPLSLCGDQHIRRQMQLLLARVYARQGDAKTAAGWFQQVLAGGSGDSLAYAAYDGLGSLMTAGRRYEQARFYYEQGARNPDPERAAAARFNLARVWELAGDRDAARRNYLRLPYLFPDQHPWVIEGLLAAAALAAEQGDFQAAVLCYRKLLDQPLGDERRKQVESHLAELDK
ncbi:MAG: tetratricopeptide repeat protein [Deltaproteobacteria bacterium]|nr:tetratricopeptide repeat protein [Candidatus Anaeroferrophillacea bacterium]